MADRSAVENQVQGKVRQARRRMERMTQRPREMLRQMPVNVGDTERQVSVAAGAILAGLGLSRRGLPGWLIAGIGGALVFRGVTGHCPSYAALGVDTAGAQKGRRGARAGVHVERSYLIDKPAEELYRHWRNFENLPRFMKHLESVRIIDEKRSHWVAKAPSVVGGRMEWDAQITHDDPNVRIDWRSLPGADVPNSGSIRFEKAMGNRGTIVRAIIDYIPPAGTPGRLLAKLLGEEPEQQVRDDLRNFKRIMETGEIPTIVGQPHGTCTGRGKRYQE